MDNLRIGWDKKRLDGIIKAGTSGTLQAVLVVKQSDGSALPSYSGWTAAIAVQNPVNGQTLDITPTVVGDAGTFTFTLTITFAPSDTADLVPGVLTGDCVMSGPSDEIFAPMDVYLTIEKTYAE